MRCSRVNIKHNYGIVIGKLAKMFVRHILLSLAVVMTTIVLMTSALPTSAHSNNDFIPVNEATECICRNLEGELNRCDGLCTARHHEEGRGFNLCLERCALTYLTCSQLC